MIIPFLYIVNNAFKPLDELFLYPPNIFVQNPTLDNFTNKTRKIEYTPEYIRKALSIERLGGTCMINLCAGGETLLSKDIVPITKELLEEGHYVMIVTNGSITSRFNEIAEFSPQILETSAFVII